ncbi:MAG: hypothetical protein M3209_14020 [Acidobacteriota bacterium]|nr:hypothetical protein [Acidobacteriota bacterium]
MRLTGRLVDLRSESWIQGQIGETREIGAQFFEKLARRSNLNLRVNQNDAGLIEDFSVLRSDEFSPEKIHPKIKDFYEQTAKYNLDVWSEWHGGFKPFGWLITILFSRRLQQLNMPISSLETSRGITSEIIQLRDETDLLIGTGWLRKMIANSSVIYAGIYSTCKPPKFPSRCMKVVFPLPNGNATVIMKPQQNSDGSLTLISAGEGFGEPGFYFIVKKNKTEAWVKYLRAMKESIRIFVDENEQLYAEHILKLYGATFLKLHYRMTLSSENKL